MKLVYLLLYTYICIYFTFFVVDVFLCVCVEMICFVVVVVVIFSHSRECDLLQFGSDECNAAPSACKYKCTSATDFGDGDNTANQITITERTCYIIYIANAKRREHKKIEKNKTQKYTQ